MSEGVTIGASPDGRVTIAAGDVAVSIGPANAEVLASVFAAIGAPLNGRAVSAVEIDAAATREGLALRLEVPAGDRLALAHELRLAARCARGQAQRLLRVE